jgi:hypothetical protein
MRARTALAVVFATAVATVATGRQDVPKGQPVVRITGMLADEKLADKAPPQGVVVSAKGWDALAAAWGIKEKSSTIDFTKTIFAVGTTRGGTLKVTPKVTDGDLKIDTTSTRDLRPGFRYELVSVPREGVKTVNGQPLPKE